MVESGSAANRTSVIFGYCTSETHLHPQTIIDNEAAFLSWVLTQISKRSGEPLGFLRLLIYYFYHCYKLTRWGIFHTSTQRYSSTLVISH